MDSILLNIQSIIKKGHYRTLTQGSIVFVDTKTRQEVYIDNPDEGDYYAFGYQLDKKQSGIIGDELEFSNPDGFLFVYEKPNNGNAFGNLYVFIIEMTNSKKKNWRQQIFFGKVIIDYITHLTQRFFEMKLFCHFVC